MEEPKLRRGGGWPGLVILLVVCIGTGMLGSLATASSVNTWYQGLEKPVFNPPSWVFAPVWTLLYAMMALACWLMLRSPGETGPRTAAFRLFLAQLAVNGIWSPLFFGLRNPALALADIAVLWVLIVLTVRAFHRHSRPAALLMLPYLAWVSFAAILNAAIVLLN